MSKINWDVYSQRRRIKMSKLLEAQNIKSYVDYLKYCIGVNVNPMTLEEFKAQTGLGNESPTKWGTQKDPDPQPKKEVKKAPTRKPKAKSKPPVEKSEGDSGSKWGIKPKKTTKKSGQ